MTGEMMALRGLLERSADADLLREMIGFAAERLMGLEVGGLRLAEPRVVEALAPRLGPHDVRLDLLDPAQGFAQTRRKRVEVRLTAARPAVLSAIRSASSRSFLARRSLS